MKSLSLSLASAALVACMAAAPAVAYDSTNNPGTVHVPAGTPNGSNNPGIAHEPAGTPNDTSNPGVANRPATTGPPLTAAARAALGPAATLPAKAFAYGYYCRTESRLRADATPGSVGTPFSQCVSGAAQLLRQRHTPAGPARLPAITATLPAKAAAYGYYCSTQSRLRADATPGTYGTPFSQCVTGMAAVATGRSSSPVASCRTLSHLRADAAPGTYGTPFSQCVSAAAQLLRQRHTTVGGS